MQLDRTTTAVVTMEMQRGICGDLAALPMLRDAVDETGAAATAGAVVARARAASVPVVHCTFSMRADRLGAAMDLPMLRAARDDPGYLLDGTAPCELLPELDLQPDDIVVNRHHGLTPFHGTGLDAVLRDLGVRTLVVTGVSLNVGIIGLTIEAINHGYRAVVVRDAVAGVPATYGTAVLHNALAAISRVIPAADVELS